MVVVVSITTGQIFDHLVGSKVDSVCGPYPSKLLSPFLVALIPAPTITLLTPRHNVRSPSILYIVDTAFDSPV